MDDCRDNPEVVDRKSDISGRELRGGTKNVDCEPLLEALLLLLLTDMIVRMEPVGERVTDAESGTAAIGLLTVSLNARHHIK